MKLLASLISLLKPPPLAEIDHAPVSTSNVTAKKLARARAEAAKRHGRQFHCDENKVRDTPPSRDLIELQQASPKTGNNVARIGKQKARST